MTTPNLKLVSRAQRTTKTRVDTIQFTVADAKAWHLPPFQRPLKVNDRVREIAHQIKEDGGVIPGILTLGVFDTRTYLVDGQHRREAFLLSGAQTGFSDVRWCAFDSMAEMGDEFVRLNSQIVRLKPDDILRGLEAGTPALTRIRRECPWIGYSFFRTSDKSPIVSMSAILRGWGGSSPETPVSYISLPGEAGRRSAMAWIQEAESAELDNMIAFLSLCCAAWGRDAVHARLYNGLNLGLCAWLYRRTVVTQYSQKSVKLDDALFRKCLAAVAADADYTDFLVGRQMGDRDRTPAYGRLRTIFARRIELETGSRPKFPSPEWAK